MVDVRHLGRLSRVLDRIAGLLLGPDEQDRPAAAGDIRREPPRILQQLLGLQKVDDVDAVPLTEDEAAHLGVPAARLVAEVHTGLQQLLDSDLSHRLLLPLCFFVRVPHRRYSRTPRLLGAGPRSAQPGSFTRCCFESTRGSAGTARPPPLARAPAEDRTAAASARRSPRPSPDA